MLRIILVALCAMAGLVDPALAQSFAMTGAVSASATGLAPDGAVASVDLTGSIPLGHPFERPLALEIGTFAFVLRDKRPHETYVALAWDDRFRLGVVRPAHDAVLPSVFADTAPWLAYTRAEYAGARTTVAAMRRTAVPFGASWQDAQGPLEWSVSAHDAAKGGFLSASAALSWRTGGWQVAGAAEGVWDRGGGWQGLNAKLGAGHDAGSWGGDAAWLHPKANGRPDALALDLWAKAGARWTLSGFGELTRTGEDAGGIAARRDLGPHSALTLAATRESAAGGLHLTLSRGF